MKEKEGGSERNIAGDERFPGTGYQIERTVWVMCVCVWWFPTDSEVTYIRHYYVKVLTITHQSPETEINMP